MKKTKTSALFAMAALAPFLTYPVPAAVRTVRQRPMGRQCRSRQ